MPITNKRSLGNAQTVLAGLRDCLVAVANGDNGEAVQTLKSLVGGSDDNFDGTLDGTETLSALIAGAHQALASDSEDDEEDYEDDADEEDAEEDEEADDDVEESKVTAKTKKRPFLTAKVAKQRSAFLDLALADTEDLEDFEIDEDEGNDIDATLGNTDEEEEYEDNDDGDEDDEYEESKVTANVKKRTQERRVSKTTTATPNKKKVVAKTKVNSDGRL